MTDRIVDPEVCARLYSEGLSLSQIALRYSVSKEAVRKALKRKAVPLRGRGGWQGGGRRAG
jgi:hypothetical protein